MAGVPSPPPGSGARGRPRSAASERAILDTTLAILHDEGYAALTIDRVAATARVSKSTIYRRWPTKEHLILSVFAQLPVVTVAEGSSFEAELLAQFGQFAKALQDSPLRSVLPRIAAECVGNPELSAALIRVNNERRGPLRTLLARAIARGEVAGDTDIELAIDVIQGAIAIRQYFLLDSLRPAWIRQLARLVMGGIAAPAARRRR
ncbi:MAG TPA: TetR/AcrR family transcriptional regulator [Solimonas sp.]|nr:TetR/AcrR family transcriptional regulator [Solimonas sp.]